MTPLQRIEAQALLIERIRAAPDTQDVVHHVRSRLLTAAEADAAIEEVFGVEAKPVADQSVSPPMMLYDSFREGEDKLYNILGGPDAATVPSGQGKQAAGPSAPPRPSTAPETGLDGPFLDADAPAQPAAAPSTTGLPKVSLGPPEVVDASTSGHPSWAVSMPPAAGDLAYAKLEIWHNRNYYREKRPEWTVSIESKRYSAPDDLVATHYLDLLPSPKKAREAARRFAKGGTITSDWAEQFCEKTYDLGDLRIGLISVKDRQHKSRNAKSLHAGFWGTLELSPERSPVRIKLYLNGHQPVVVDRLHPTRSTSPRGCYGPTASKARRLSMRQTKATKCRPANVVA